MEYPRLGRGVAATRLLEISTSRPPRPVSNRYIAATIGSLRRQLPELDAVLNPQERPRNATGGISLKKLLAEEDCARYFSGGLVEVTAGRPRNGNRPGWSVSTRRLGVGQAACDILEKVVRGACIAHCTPDNATAAAAAAPVGGQLSAAMPGA